MNLRKTKFNITWEVFFAIGVFSLFLLHMLKLIAPLRANDLYNTYGIVAIAALSAIYFYKKGLSGPWEVKLFIAYVAWVLITRWLNKDFYLLVDFKFVMMVMMSFLFFAVGTVLNSRQREILLDVLSIVYGGFFVIMSILGIFITVTNTYIHLPPENVWITLKTIWYTGKSGDIYYSLNLLSSPTAIGAGRVYIAWALLIYQIIKRKKFITKVLLLICILMLHIALPLFHCRSIQISLSISYGMLALLFAIKYLGKSKHIYKFIVVPVITAVTFVTCFFSFDLSNTLISKVYDFTAPRFEVFYENLDHKFNQDYFGIVLTGEELAALNADIEKKDFFPTYLRAELSPKNTQVAHLSTQSKMTDPRNVFQNYTLSGRTIIWQSGIIALKHNPLVGFCGNLTNHYMDAVNEIRLNLFNYPKPTSHMHNMFFEVLMITGFPGLLLVLCWSLLMVKKIIIIFFSKTIGNNLIVKSLTIPIAGIFIFNLMEIVVFGKLDIIGMCFFILAGIFVGYYNNYQEHLRKTHTLPTKYKFI